MNRPWLKYICIACALILALVAIVLFSATRPVNASPLAAAPHPDALPHAAEITQSKDGQYTYLNTAVHDFNRCLQAVVNANGLVDYNMLRQATQRQELDRYIHTIAYLNHARYEQWSSKRQLCFWINAYNALTLQIVRDHYPVARSLFGHMQNLLGQNIPQHSIRNLPFVWEKTTFLVMKQSTTLDQIEHQILRQQFKEPRIHMAINCASIGCPPLRNELYQEHKLEEQLESQTRQFLLSYPESTILINQEQKRVDLSAILQWFAEDFQIGNSAPTQTFQSARNPHERSVLIFCSRYVKAEDANFLRNGSYDVHYRAYNWSLNDANLTQ